VIGVKKTRGTKYPLVFHMIAWLLVLVFLSIFLTDSAMLRIIKQFSEH
jgi:hypothetical protein